MQPFENESPFSHLQLEGFLLFWLSSHVYNQSARFVCLFHAASCSWCGCIPAIHRYTQAWHTNNSVLGWFWCFYEDEYIFLETEPYILVNIKNIYFGGKNCVFVWTRT